MTPSEVVCHRLRRSCRGRGGSRRWPFVVSVLWWWRVGGWGCARRRQVRTHGGVLGRVSSWSCRDRGCATTHVLLPDVCLAVRRDVVEVIGEALSSAGRRGIGGWGANRSSGETVRDRRPRFRSRAESIAAHFLRWAWALDASFDSPADQGSLMVDALEAIGVCTRGGVGAAVEAGVVAGVGADRGGCFRSTETALARA